MLQLSFWTATMDYRPAPIRDRRRVLRPGQRYGLPVLALVAWVLFLWLFRPVLQTLFDLLSGYVLSVPKLSQADVAKLIRFFGSCLVLIFLLCGALIGWARYNRFRFRRREHRTTYRPPVTATDLTEFFMVDASLIASCQSSPRIVMHHTETGFPKSVECTGTIASCHLVELVPVTKTEFHYRGCRLRKTPAGWLVSFPDIDGFICSDLAASRQLVDDCLGAASAPRATAHRGVRIEPNTGFCDGAWGSWSFTLNNVTYQVDRVETAVALIDLQLAASLLCRLDGGDTAPELAVE